jgi:hypothetical protein
MLLPCCDLAETTRRPRPAVHPGRPFGEAGHQGRQGRHHPAASAAAGRDRLDGGQVTPFYRPVEYLSADIPALIGQIRSGGKASSR